MSGIDKDTIGSGRTLAAAADVAGLHQRIEELELALATANASAVPVDSNLRMRQMLEACPIGIAILAQDDGRRLFVNGTLVEILGSGTREELLAADFKATWTDQSMMTEVWSAFVERRYVLNFEAERVRRDGSRWWVLLNTQPIVFEGVDAGIVWHVDISRRMRAVEAARESENRCREAVESLSDAFALFDPDDQLIFCNRVFRDLNPGLAANIRPGMTFEDMVRDNLANGRIVVAAGREEEFVAQRMAQHRNPPDEAMLSQRADGRWLLLREKRAPDGGTFLVNTDITELKEREDALRAEKERSEQASGHKSQFLATISHELRTPLNAIMGFSDILQRQLFGELGDVRYRDYAGDIFASGQHLLDLINDILDLSRIEAGQYEMTFTEVDIADVAQSATDVLKELANSEGLNIHISIQAGLPLIRADLRAVRQILLNLLSNAIKFTPSGGEVRVEVSQESGNGVDSGIHIAVADTGIGIAAENMELILMPFSQVASNGLIKEGGTGLGLSIVKSLIELQGGVLQIDSKVGIGTRVTVRFPNSHIIDGSLSATT